MRGFLFLFASAAFAASLFASAASAQDYKLGVGDLLKITVYENEDLTTHARVGGDGGVSVPLAGKLKVAGLSVTEAEKKLTKLLADGYIIDPHVSVFVEEYRSKKVTILGEVTKPGLYELTGEATVLEIISKAGGLTDKAGARALIKRKASKRGDDKYITVNLKELIEKGQALGDAAVQDGDNIFVTKSGFIYVTGEVKKPGAYKYEEGATVIKAIALAEGLTDKAAPGRTVLIRKKADGEEVRRKVEMGYQVKPDDVISVPESFF